MSLTFRTKLLVGYVALVAIAELLTVVALDRSLSAELVVQLSRRLEEQARGAVEWVATGRHPDVVAERLARIAAARVTVLDARGRVAGDSQVGADGTGALREDPSTAPEIVAARTQGVGRATRGDVQYVAVRTEDGIIRLAAPLSDVNATLTLMRQRLLLASLAVFALAVALAFVAARVLARPLVVMRDAAHRIALGAYDVEAGSAAQDEFGDLARSLKTLATQLDSRFSEIVTQRDRLQAVLSSMAEGVVVLDQARRIQLANPSAEALIGRGALADRSLADVIGLPALLAVFDNAAESKRGQAAEVVDGERVLLATVQPLASGGAVGVLHDVTGLRRTEEQRRQFVGDVSHEIGTPLAAIQGYAETLLAGRVDVATTREFLEVIHRHAKRIAHLVDDLRLLSATEARARDERVREPVAISEVIGHVQSALRQRAEERRVTLRVEVDGASVRALGDPDHVERILLNLVDNAVKYGREGGLVVVRARVVEGAVCMEVIDDGRGIAAEHIARVFDRFYRVDPGRSRDKGGTGLGLAIVKQLAEAMGGSASVESENGKGTRFVVTLPAC